MANNCDMKKPLLILVLLLLALALAACAVENFGTIATNNQAGRVLLITGPSAEDQEAYAAATALSERYGRYLPHQELSSETVADPERYAAAVLQALADTKADAVILAPAYSGAAVACAKTSVLTIALRPREEPAVIAAAADLVVDADYAAVGEVAVKQAADLGATAFVYYRDGRAAYSEELLKRTQAAAAQAGLTFILKDLPQGDLAAGWDSSLEQLKAQYATESAAGGDSQAAEDCDAPSVVSGMALFSDDSSAEEQLIAAALRNGCLCPPQLSLTPYGAYGRVFGVAEPGDRYNSLSEYLKLINRDLVIKLELPGRFVAWQRPLDFVEADAAAEYAFLRLAGQASDPTAFRQCLLNANAKTISTYDQAGAIYANYWLHLINIRVFDESG